MVHSADPAVATVQRAGHPLVSLAQDENHDDRDNADDLQRHEHAIRDADGVRKDEDATQKPEEPRPEAHAGGAVLSGQVEDLGQVGDRHDERPDKSSDLRKLVHDLGFRPPKGRLCRDVRGVAPCLLRWRRDAELRL